MDTWKLWRHGNNRDIRVNGHVATDGHIGTNGHMETKAHIETNAIRTHSAKGQMDTPELLDTQK